MAPSIAQAPRTEIADIPGVVALIAAEAVDDAGDRRSFDEAFAIAQAIRGSGDDGKGDAEIRNGLVQHDPRWLALHKPAHPDFRHIQQAVEGGLDPRQACIQLGSGVDFLTLGQRESLEAIHRRNLHAVADARARQVFEDWLHPPRSFSPTGNRWLIYHGLDALEQLFDFDRLRACPPEQFEACAAEAIADLERACASRLVEKQAKDHGLDGKAARARYEAAIIGRSDPMATADQILAQCKLEKSVPVATQAWDEAWKLFGGIDQYRKEGGDPQFIEVLKKAAIQSAAKTLVTSGPEGWTRRMCVSLVTGCIRGNMHLARPALPHPSPSGGSCSIS